MTALERHSTVQRLAVARDARVVLLVQRITQIVGSGEILGNGQAPVIRHYRSLVHEMSIDATVLACVCRRPEDIVHSLLGRSSLVVMGGRLGWVRPSRDERLDRRLTAEGYSVVFAARRAEQSVKSLGAPRGRLKRKD